MKETRAREMSPGEVSKRLTQKRGLVDYDKERAVQKKKRIARDKIEDLMFERELNSY